MWPLLGMAGLAEAAEEVTLQIGYAGLLLAAMMTWIGLVGGWRSGAVAAIGVLALIAFLFQPWRAFQPTTSTDLDWHYWLAQWRQFATAWCISAIAAGAAAVRAFCFPRRPET